MWQIVENDATTCKRSVCALFFCFVFTRPLPHMSFSIHTGSKFCPLSLRADVACFLLSSPAALDERATQVSHKGFPVVTDGVFPLPLLQLPHSSIIYTFSVDKACHCADTSLFLQWHFLFPGPTLLLSKQHLNGCLTEYRPSSDLPLAFANVALLAGNKINICSFVPSLLPLINTFPSKPHWHNRGKERPPSGKKNKQPSRNCTLALNGSVSGFTHLCIENGAMKRLA